MKNIKTEGTLDTEYRQEIRDLLLLNTMSTAQLILELGIGRARLLKVLHQMERDRQIFCDRGYWQLR